MTSEPSGRLYTVVTKHWPRIAGGLVVVIGLVELVVGGMTADSGVEFYLMAWAGTTGGLWFLFGKAEELLSAESRRGIAAALTQSDFRASLRDLPAQFAYLFDRIFGHRHVSFLCVRRSVLVSLCTFAVLLIGKFSGGWTPDGYNLNYESALEAGRVFFATVFLYVAILNFIPDYLSLLQTRWMVRLLEDGRAPASVLLPLDAVATAAIAFGAMMVVNEASLLTVAPITAMPSGDVIRPTGLAAVVPTLGVLMAPGRNLRFNLMQVSLATTFFTSAWLWIYALSVLVSRVLLRMNSGVGFLLRVTDVERQPFRSMGFVSVIIVSVLFALGLPLVLL